MGVNTTTPLKHEQDRHCFNSTASCYVVGMEHHVAYVARLNLWPAGHHKLGVIWAKGVNWNKGEIDRHIAAGKYSAAQCLSRLTDGMPNHIRAHTEWAGP